MSELRRKDSSHRRGGQRDLPPSGVGHGGGGFRLALVAVDEKGRREVAEEIGRRVGEAATYRTDISDPSQVEARAKEVEPRVLVNGAAVLLMADFEDAPPGTGSAS